ncbi:iron complex transport system substrate-binding protein [Halobacillus alkaliphilus]|uniref:Iron complex transport system substrate-binding protein n=1 Tax=Halobacillus alkaliphilus TaxID=396056 RepID=A0A1I2LL69_9BACI|nr:iron-siderophore ABC transporter substrate-binding protein [Halobacillus alkaliphilus]SFF80252.1 iron complex transport system substrate-binding protein [Halobacillus alkaliphilus]
MLNHLLHKKWGLLLIVLLLATLLAACGSDGASSESNSSDEGSDSSSEASNTREIEHAMGTTTIEGTPEKVVTLYQGATDTATAFDVEPVGIVESWVEKPIYKYLRDDLEGTPLVGEETQPNLEEIAQLNPDVIFASKLRHEDIYEKLNKIAPTVAIDQVYEFKETVKLMGETLDKQDKADEILTNWDERIEDFNTKASEKLGDEWPLNVSILNFRSDHARIYFDSFAGTILREAGFTRPENQQSDEWGMKLTDKESINEMNADVFYIFMSDEPAIKDNYEEWTNHPLWKNLDAVKNDEVHMVDEVTWNMAGGIRAANLMLDDLYDRFDLEK